jgi:hypothetical protein
MVWLSLQSQREATGGTSSTLSEAAPSVAKRHDLNTCQIGPATIQSVLLWPRTMARCQGSLNLHVLSPVSTFPLGSPVGPHQQDASFPEPSPWPPCTCPCLHVPQLRKACRVQDTRRLPWAPTLTFCSWSALASWPACSSWIF